ncbi:hypothetical protein ACX1C1_26410 [Paenibacillus sp. strain BS8-2]
MIFTAIITATLLFLWIYWIGVTTARELLTALRGKKRLHGNLRSRMLATPFHRVLQFAERGDLLRLRIDRFHRQLVLLKGASWTIEQTRAELSLAIGQGYGVMVMSSILAMLAKEPILTGMGGVVGVVIILRQFVDASRNVERRRRAILAALPDLIAKLMLLVGAGETVQGAFAKCRYEKRTKNDNPLHQEWRFAMAAMDNGQSFGTAIERMNRNCSVQEISVFATVLLLNYRRGGDQFVLALKEFSYSIWEKRKAAALTSGEEASSKLVFPLVGILFIMMVIVAAPAFLLMS